MVYVFVLITLKYIYFSTFSVGKTNPELHHSCLHRSLLILVNIHGIKCAAVFRLTTVVFSTGKHTCPVCLNIFHHVT